MRQPFSGIKAFASLMPRYVITFLVLALVGSCAPEEPRTVMERVSQEEAEEVLSRLDIRDQGLQEWSDLRPGLESNLEYVRSQREVGEEPPDIYGLEVPWWKLEKTIERMKELLPRLENGSSSLLAEHFQFYRLQPDPLYTGYFWPEIKASLERRPGYETPIYGVPRDLRVADLGRFHPRWEGETLVYRIEDGQIKPYYSREEIRRDVDLQEEAPVLAWAKDPMELFILQIQGSGKLRLPDGEIKHIGYAAKNGRQYRSLGRVLYEKGYLDRDELDLESITDFLETNSELVPYILDTNPSYVFFRFREDGPYGAIQAKLTPMASLAVDPSILPLGSALIYEVDLPQKDREDRLSLTGLGLAQDVGGAVTGHHLDLYFGSGEKARYGASHMKETGGLLFLVAK